MAFTCSMFGHAPEAIHHHNQGLDFTMCHHCGCDLIRAEDGEWTEVPQGFRVVWREFGRSDDAGSVAARMRRNAPEPRRAPRNARPPRRRDPRGNPLAGAASLLGALAKLSDLLCSADGKPHPDTIEDNGQYVICLPGARDLAA